MKMTHLSLIVSAGLLSAAPWLEATAQQQAPQAPNMTFFVTGAGPGKGADLGGIEGADRYCQQLAQQAGAGSKIWRAYLSTQAADGKPAINARDRIGRGPWQNFKGEVVAQSVDDLHSDHNKLNAQTTLTGTRRYDSRHGLHARSSRRAHRLTARWSRLPGRGRSTCHNWTSSAQGPRCWATSTERVCATIRRHIRGILHIPRADRTAVAAKPICAALVATVCSIASPRNRATLQGLVTIIWGICARQTSVVFNKGNDDADGLLQLFLHDPVAKPNSRASREASRLSAASEARAPSYALIRILAKATFPVCTCRPMKPESGSSLFLRPRKRSVGSPASAVNFVHGCPLSSTSYVRSVTAMS